MARAVDRVDSRSIAYKQGKLAYGRGLDSSKCPFPCGPNRRDWIGGWLTAQSNSKLASLFRKFNVFLV